MGNKRLPLDEEAIVVREEGDVDVVARERADRVLRLPEAHRHELGAVPLVAPEDVVTQIPWSRPSSTATGLLDVHAIRVGVLALCPAAPRAGNHMSFNASPRRRISQPRGGERKYGSHRKVKKGIEEMQRYGWRVVATRPRLVGAAHGAAFVTFERDVPARRRSPSPARTSSPGSHRSRRLAALEARQA